jgi:hypothetical protein
MLAGARIVSFATSTDAHRPAPAPGPHSIPQARIGGLHIGMKEDSVKIIFRNIALRSDTLHVDSLTLMESDSVRLFGQPAYIQVQLLHHKIRTIVVNFHPLVGDRYLSVRDVLDQYLMRLFGGGVEEKEESLTHHRWETEEGTMELSHSDKYERVFLRLGKPRE